MPIDPQTAQQVTTVDAAIETAEDLKDGAKKKRSIADILKKASSRARGISSLTSAAERIPGLSIDQLEDLGFAKDALGEVSSMFEATAIITGLMKNADSLFYQALVYLLVQQMIASLEKQEKMLTEASVLLSQLSAKSAAFAQLLGGSTDTRTLSRARDLVNSAVESLEGALDFVESRPLAIHAKAAFAGRALERAQKLLLADLGRFIDVPSYADMLEMYQFLGKFFVDMDRIRINYIREYGITISLYLGIIHLKDNMAGSFNAIGQSVTEAALNRIIKSIYKKTLQPIDKDIAKDPSTLKIAAAELRYSATIEFHIKDIRSWFGSVPGALQDFTAVNNAYITLVAKLESEPYLNGTGIINEIKDIFVKITVPSGDAAKFAQSSASALQALSARSGISIGKLKTRVRRIINACNVYGVYESALLKTISGAFKAVGQSGTVLLEMAKGNPPGIKHSATSLVTTKEGTENAPQVIKAMTATASLMGSDAGVNVLNALSMADRKDREEEQAREGRSTRNIWDVMDEQQVDEISEAEADEETADLIIAGVKGKPMVSEDVPLAEQLA